MEQVLKPFQKIVVAYDDSQAARDALSAGIELCKLLGTSLQTITVIEPAPAYTAFSVAVSPGIEGILDTDRRQFYGELMETAVAEGRRQSIEVTGHLVEADEIDGVLSFFVRVGRTCSSSDFGNIALIFLACGARLRAWRKMRHAACWPFIHG